MAFIEIPNITFSYKNTKKSQSSPKFIIAKKQPKIIVTFSNILSYNKM